MYKEIKNHYKNLKNQKGMTIIFLALILLVLIFIAGMGIDLAYMKYVKNQTQVAADSAALAGAGKLVELGDLLQQPARDEAVMFSGLNKVAGQTMTVASDSSNTLSNGNDITLGHFDYTLRQYFPNSLPVNSIEVRTRRTDSSPIGPVGVFLGKVGGWRQMSAASIAIAGRPVRPGAPIVLCIDACSHTMPRTYYFKETHAPSPSECVGWTELSTTSRSTDLGPNSVVSQMIRGEIPMPNVCCEKIYTNNGLGNAATHQLPNQFAIEAAKTGGYWDVLVPIVGQVPPDCPSQVETKGCPPGAQPTEPYLVTRYARIRIENVLGNPRPGIYVTSMDCRSCPADSFLADKAALLQ